MEPLTLADHILFAFLAFVLPLLMLWRQQPMTLAIPVDSSLKIRIYWTNSIVLWLGVIVVIGVWLLHDRSFSSLGFRLPAVDTFPHWMIVIAGFLLLYFGDVAVSWTSEDEHPAAAILPATWREFLHFGSVVSVSAAVCEEIVFRGFLITYLLTVLEGHQYAAAIAAIGSAFVFGIVHSYQGWAALLKIMLLSVVFAWLFIMTKSLLLLIFLHFTVDFCSGMFAVIRKKSEDNLMRVYR